MRARTHASLLPRQWRSKARLDCADRQTHSAPAAGRGIPQSVRRLMTTRRARARAPAGMRAAKTTSETRCEPALAAGQDQIKESECPGSPPKNMRPAESIRDLAAITVPNLV